MDVPHVELPDLCTPGSVLLIVLVGFAVALFYTLARVPDAGTFFVEFGLAVLFVQWVVLLSAGLACMLRRLLKRSSLLASAMAFMVIPVVCLLASLIVVRFVPAGDPALPCWFVLRNTLISLLASLALARYLVLQRRWKHQVAAEARARLDALQARVRPHFLFNTLNTISSLIHDRPEEAERATLDLSDLLRSGLTDQPRHSLEEELELVRGFLRIESLRLGERLEVDWQLDEELPLEAELPVLLIQPLVENAVVHGIARLPSGGRLLIRGERTRRSRVRFLIENPLPDEVDDDRQPEGNRMALDNVRQRLALAWEEGARLKTRRENGRFSAELILPICS
jgi:two-component system, LytTR family, sensor histidine kinase AlgZ